MKLSQRLKGRRGESAAALPPPPGVKEETDAVLSKETGCVFHKRSYDWCCMECNEINP